MSFSSRNRKMAVKPFIMTNSVVVGVGNIYATEALFRSGIRPDRAACHVSKKRYVALAKNIKEFWQLPLIRVEQRCAILLIVMVSQATFSRR